MGTRAGLPGADGAPYGPDECVVEAGYCSINAFPAAGLLGRCEPGKVKGILRLLPATIPMRCPRWSGVGRNGRRNLLQDTWCAGLLTLPTQS